MLLPKMVMPLALLGLFQAFAESIIGADGKEYHPQHHSHHHKHHKNDVVHVDHKASIPSHRAMISDAPPTNQRGGLISAPALGHVTAPVEHHDNLHHLRKHHKVHMLNEKGHAWLNNKGEPKDEEEVKEEEKGAKESKEPKKEKKEQKKSKDKHAKEEKKEHTDEEDTKDDKNKHEQNDKGDEEADDDKATASAGWSNGKNEGKPMPEQGFSGDDVAHDDMKSMTSDWQKEFGPKMKGMDSYREICAKPQYHNNEWCRLHRGERQYGTPARSKEWFDRFDRSDAMRFSPMSVALIALVFVALP